MFFPEKIVSIKGSDTVLEVGPGGSPHPRSDVLLEKTFNEKEAEAQRGYASKLETDKKTIFYTGGKFPFKDNEFDYVICSHVLEHVPEDELDLFIKELQRVAPRGYVEYPTAYYEVINYQDVHLWLMNYINNEIIFLKKSIIKPNFIDLTLRKLFYSDPKNSSIFKKNKEFFFVGFEWKEAIPYKIVHTFEDLDDNAIDKWEHYFLEQLPPAKLNTLKRVKIFGKKLINKFISVCTQKPYYTKGKISKSAIIDDLKLVEIGKNAEVQDFVIIKTFSNKVLIGDNSQINPFTVIYGGAGVEIGNNVMIAPHCAIAAGTHNYLQTDKPMRFSGHFDKGPIIIEDDVWIGANCTITDGVRVSKGAVIGANSVVTKDVNPYDIVGGCPAKVISNRLGLSNDRS